MSEPLPTEVALLIDQCCVEFEQAWRSGEQPRLEDYLHRLDSLAEFRGPLFKELLLVELAESGESAAKVEDYLDRFPDDREAVEQVFRGIVDTTRQATAKSSAGRSAAPELPDRVGRYEIERRLGRGHFGEVYLAVDPSMDCRVAIKRLLIDNVHSALQSESDAAKLVESLLHEARLAAKLRKHPGIVSILDVLAPSSSGERGDIYLVQDYIEGGDLRERMRQHSISAVEAAEILLQVAEAVSHAHTHGIYHRDLKPGNILLDANNKPYITDFGLAIDEKLQRGRVGEIAGTYPYMAPEQTRGESHLLDGRADIWALGVILYEVLTGVRPFRGSTPGDLFDEICRREPRPPRMVKPQIPADLERICLRCLSKRMTDRYSTALDLAEELRAVVGSGTGSQSKSPAKVTVVPRGLRCFESDDADFFLELLPGPRDRNGLPDSIRFWKQKIEQPSGDETFRVGLLYGPSGSGKTSFVKAGLLPKLDRVLPIYVEATAIDTETRLLVELRKIAPALSTELPLPAAIARLRDNPQLSGHRKTLIVLDQFEQWLQSRREFGGEQLIDALRQCDGGRVQVLILVRADFWMAISRFMDDLEVTLVKGENLAAVDLFDHDHAQHVLSLYGRAFRKLDGEKEPSTAQKAFMRDVVERISREGKVVCVQISVVAEMLKDKAWIPETIASLGGSAGIGESFLEDAFSSPSANPLHRRYEQQARAVLKSLLPERGSDIKGHMIEWKELQAMSGCADDPRTFEQVIRILDQDLRLITPTDPDSRMGDQQRATEETSHYQLTHDYLIPALRNWLTRKQRSTARGRAELLLEERADAWSVQPENRNLPSISEFVDICLRTSRDSWSGTQKDLIQRATRVYGLRVSIAALLLVAMGLVGWAGAGAIRERNDAVRSEEMVQTVTSCSLNELGEQIQTLRPYRRWCDPLLQEVFEGNSDDSPKKLRAALALLEVDAEKFGYVYRRLLTADARELAAIVTLLRPVRDQVVDRSWELIGGGDALKSPGSQGLLAAAAALAWYDPGDPRWSDLQQQIIPYLLHVPLDEVGNWKSLLEPVGPMLVDALYDEYSDRKPGDPARDLSATFLADYAGQDRERLVELIAKADPSHFSLFVPAIRRHGQAGSEALQNAFELAVETKPADIDSFQLESGLPARIEAAGGLVNGRMAYVQSLKLSEFPSLNEALMDAGYYAVSCRPYAETVDHLVAACWHKGDRSARVEIGLEAAALLEKDGQMRELGFEITDLTYYPSADDPQGPHRLAATWTESPNETTETILFADLAPADHHRDKDRLTEDGYSLDRVSLRIDEKGFPLLATVWRKSKAHQRGSNSHRIRYASRTGDVYPGDLQTDLQLFRIDLSKPDFVDQVFNSKFLDHQAELAKHQPDQSLNQIAEAALGVGQYQLHFRNTAQSVDLLERLLDADGLTSRQLNQVRQFLAHVYYSRGDLAKLEAMKESLWESSYESQKSTLEIRCGVLAGDPQAVGKALKELVATCNRYNSGQAALIAARGCAIAANLADSDAADHRQSALDWFGLLMERNPQTKDLDKVLVEEDFDSIRGEPEYQQHLEAKNYSLRFSEVWNDSLQTRSSTLRQLTSTHHRQRARELADAGYRPVVVDAVGQPEASISSLWHLDVLPEPQRIRRSIVIANLAIALTQCGDTATAKSVIAGDFGRSARTQLIDRCVSSDTPPAFLVNLLKVAESDSIRRSTLLALAEYPRDRIGDDVDATEAAIRKIAASTTASGTLAAAQWCLRRWGADFERDFAVPDEIGYLTAQGQRMIRVEPTRFLMGSPNWESSRGEFAEDQHWRVIDRTYALADTEVTIAQFEEFLNDPRVQAYYEDRIKTDFTLAYAPRPDCPRISVRWFDAALFCQWRSESEGMPEDQWCFPGIWSSAASDFRLPKDVLHRTGYRLPTESEWEYACRAGSSLKYPFGTDDRLLANHAWYLLNSLPPDYASRPVATMPPNDFGFYDLLGNVNEWCLNAKDTYPAPFDGYLQSDEARSEDLHPLANERAIRGGSFDSIPRELRCADRKTANAESYKRYTLGFRIARTLTD